MRKKKKLVGRRYWVTCGKKTLLQASCTCLLTRNPIKKWDGPISVFQFNSTSAYSSKIAQYKYILVTHHSKILCMDIYIHTHSYTYVWKLEWKEKNVHRDGSLMQRRVQGRHTQINHWFLRKTWHFLNTINSLKGSLNCGRFRQSCKWQNMKCGKRGDYGEKRKAQECFGEFKKQSTEARFFLKTN